MKLTLEGISFSYYGDTITYRWPWSRKGSIRSTLFSQDFNSFREYWQAVGKESALIKLSSVKDKISGYEWIEVLANWSAVKFPDQYVVVLVDVNPNSRGPAFWSRIPKEHIQCLLKDVVVLRCKDKTELVTLIQATCPTFAEAMGFLNGTLIECNNN